MGRHNSGRSVGSFQNIGALSGGIIKRRAVFAAAVAASFLGIERGMAAQYIYTPNAGTGDTWSTGADWSATPVSATTTELTFGSNAALLTGLVNTNTDNITGAFQANILDLNGNGSSGASSITIASTSPATGIALFNNGTASAVVNLSAVNASGATLAYNVTAPITSTTTSNVIFQGAGTAAFQFSGGITTAGSLYKSGGASTVTLAGNNTVAALVIGLDAANGNASNGGTVVAAAGSSITINGSTKDTFIGGNTSGVTSLASNAVLDLTNAASFTANVNNFNLMDSPTGSSTSGAVSLKLGALSNITCVGSVRVGEADLNINTVPASMSIVPNGIANFKTIQWSQQYNKGQANVQLGAGAVFNISGATAGARATFVLGNSTVGTSSSTVGSFDASATGAAFSLVGNYMLIGSDNQTGAASVTSAMVLSTSALNHLDLNNGSGGALGVLTVGRQAQGTSAAIATGTLTINGLDATSSIVSTDNGPAIAVGVARNAGQGVGTLNLNATTGVLTITTTGSAITGVTNTLTGGGNSTVNFNGITIRANASSGASSQWITKLAHANICDNGVNFNTSSYTVTTDQIFSHGGVNPTDGGITKSGVGTLIMTGASTYNGPTTINAGTLNLSGLLASTINVNSNATLIFGGTTTGGINANSGSTIVGTGSTTGALNFSGNDTLNFDPTNSGFLTAGSINASSAVVTVTPLSTTSNTGIVVLSASGGITGAIGTNFMPSSRGTLSFDNPASPTELLFSASSAASLVWQGGDATHPTFWDLHTTANFNNSGTTDVFFNGDNVLFDDTASSFVVNVQGTLQPASVTFNNSAHNYTVQGGTISGATSLAMTGAGNVTITSSNTYTGGTSIAAGGTIQLGDGTVLTGSLGTGAIADNGTLVANFGAGSVTLANAISGNGSLVQMGPSSTLHITGANASFTGTTNISAGTLQLDPTGTLGSGPIVNNGALIANTSVMLPGSISGGGSVAVTSPNTLTLTASNTYTGNTNIASGATLAIGNGGTTGSISTGNITDAGMLAYNRSDSTVLGYSLNVSGAVSTLGAGNVSLTGSNSIGSLYVGLNTPAGSLIVPSGASLSVGLLPASDRLFIGYTGVNGIASTGTLDASAANAFNANVFQLILGDAPLAGGNTASGTLKLPTSANLTISNAFTIGNSGGAFSGTSLVTTAAGAGTVSILSPLDQFGYQKNHGSFIVGAGDTVNFAGSNGSTATLMEVGFFSFSGSGFWSGAFDGSAGNVSANLTGLHIGDKSDGSGAATMDGQFILSNSALNHLSITGTTTGPSGNAWVTGLVSLGVVNPTDTAATVAGTPGSATGTLTFGNLDSSSSITTTDSGPAIYAGGSSSNGLSVGVGVVNLNGGRLTFNSSSATVGPAIKGGTGLSTLNLNGATIASNVSNSSFITGLTAVNIRNGGVTFDTGSNNLSIGQVLSHSNTGTIGAVTITNPGSGYNSSTTVAISPGNTGWTGTATASVNSSDGSISGINLNNVQNFASAPTLTINGGGGSGATAAVAYTADNAIDGGLTKIGTGTLTLSGSNTYTGGTNINGGTVVAGSNSALGTGAANLANTATLALAVNASSGLATALANPVNVAGAALASLQLAPTVNYSSGTVGAITVGTGGQLNLLSPTGVARGVLVVPSINSSAGTLNVAANALDITGQSVGDVTALVRTGYNNGNWNGSGISSSAAAGNSTHLTALGVVQNGSLFGTNAFDGITPGSADTLVKYTYYGDANLDGQVNSADYTQIDAGYLSNGAMTGWQNGDFNYDGVINGSDYTLIDNAFNMQGATLAAEVASPTAQIGNASAVPEPTSIGLIAVAAVGMLSRRRRRERKIA